MATYDNKHWLLCNIRNSFIATHTDNVIAGENYPKLFIEKSIEEKARIKERSGSKSSLCEGESQEEFVREPVTEFDPYPDMEEEEDDLDMIGSYIRYDDGAYRFISRQRTDTALWLEKKDPVMRKASKMKIIKWEDPPILTDEERAQVFPRKDFTITEDRKEKYSNGKSLLAEQLENCPQLPHRQYLEYAKFDGMAQVGLSTKTFKIFMTMLPESLANYPITVCVIVTAKIQDLIGFTCYKYSLEHPEVTLGPANSYGLCIAEDDGEVDDEFPCLDANEPCSKFDFTCLGLVELKTKVFNHVASSFPEDCLKGFPSRSITMASTASDILEHGVMFNQNRTSSSLDQDMMKMESHFLASEAPQYKAYRVQLCNKVRANISVQLGISMDSIEIEPLQNGSQKFWSRMKPLSYSIETIACCNIIEYKSNSTAAFRLKYSLNYSNRGADTSAGSGSFLHSTPSFKSRDFECDQSLAKEIVDKINRILELRSSACSRDYKAAKERKLQSRRSFHLPRHHT